MESTRAKEAVETVPKLEKNKTEGIEDDRQDLGTGGGGGGRK